MQSLGNRAKDSLVTQGKGIQNFVANVHIFMVIDKSTCMLKCTVCTVCINIIAFCMCVVHHTLSFGLRHFWLAPDLQ
jgi:hypothetical protein